LGLAADKFAVTGQVDGVLLDLGVSSPQLDDAERGFSFRQDGPLDMRMDPQHGVSAAQWLAHVSEQELVTVLKVYGEERFAKRIARAILSERDIMAITTTKRLASIVAEAVPTREKGKDPATRTFQAIRIQINHELDDLKTCLDAALEVLKVGGRLVVISFHSLEDRIVKRFMREQSRADHFPHDLPIQHVELTARMKTLGKAIKASPDEVRKNARARSAIMRVAEKQS
jgi:16S rRNA (cytosine1402-N4)-methyltransferase